MWCPTMLPGLKKIAFSLVKLLVANYWEEEQLFTREVVLTE